MTVEAIRLMNFMAFEDTGWIELRRLCLLFGRNSSGKSCIFRALRMLRQSLDATSTDQQFRYVDRNGVDVGDFATILHVAEGENREDAADNKALSFGFRCRLDNAGVLRSLSEVAQSARERKGLSRLPVEDIQDWVDLWLRYDWSQESGRAWLFEFTIRCPWVTPGDEQDVLLGAVTVEQSFEEWEWWPWSNLLIQEDSEEESVWPWIEYGMDTGFLPTLTFRFPRNTGSPSVLPDDLAFVLAAFTETRETLVQFLRSIAHIPPLRPEPRRVFLLDQAARTEWENSGLKGFLHYLDGDFGDITIELDEHDQEVKVTALDHVSRTLKELGLAEKASATPSNTYGPHSRLATVSVVEIQEKAPGVLMNLADVGSGVAQVLPVITELIYANPDQLIMIEQPELHLHPFAQADLADMLAAASNRGARLLVETHSESLILRLRRRIAERTLALKRKERPIADLDPDALSVYFIERAAGCSSCHHITYDEWGRYKDEPEGFSDFFSSDFDELLALDEARLLLQEEG